MAGIADFVAEATEKLGIGEGEAKAGVGALLKAIQGSVSKDEFQQVEEALPDAADAMSAAPAEESAGGGLGGLLSQAAGALGGDAGGAMGILDSLKKTGISTDKLGSFASLFLDFIKKKLPAGLVEGLLGKLGGLKDLLG